MKIQKADTKIVCPLKQYLYFFPTVLDSEFNWKAACMEREEQHRLWTNNAHSMQFFKFTEGIFAPVDAVHLMKVSCLAVVECNVCNHRMYDKRRNFALFYTFKFYIWVDENTYLHDTPLLVEK